MVIYFGEFTPLKLLFLQQDNREAKNRISEALGSRILEAFECASFNNQGVQLLNLVRDETQPANPWLATFFVSMGKLPTVHINI